MSLRSTAEFVCNSVQANRIAHNARNELYHFLMAVEEYTLDAVVQETRRLLEDRGYSYIEASRISIERASYMLEIASGNKTYQPVRDSLRNERRTENTYHTARLDYDDY